MPSRQLLQAITSTMRQSKSSQQKSSCKLLSLLDKWCRYQQHSNLMCALLRQARYYQFKNPRSCSPHQRCNRWHRICKVPTMANSKIFWWCQKTQPLLWRPSLIKWVLPARNEAIQRAWSRFGWLIRWCKRNSPLTTVQIARWMPAQAWKIFQWELMQWLQVLTTIIIMMQ